MFKRLKKWFTIDHCVDLAVDLLLIIVDVISSPILIVMRLLRHFVGEWIINGIKSVVRKIAHWFEYKREYRLANGHGVFRTYWWLIILSPLIVTGGVLAIAILSGLAEGLSIAFDDFENMSD